MRNQGLGSWPARRARMSPQRVAFSHDGDQWTYAEVYERVTRFAHALRDLGVRADDRIAYLGPNHPAFAETLFAAGMLDAVFVPLNTRLAESELRFILSDSAADVLVYGPQHREAGRNLAAGMRVTIAVDPDDTDLETGAGYGNILAAANTEPIDVPVDLDRTCLIMYTSGTTGRPKGAMLSHGNLTWNCYNALIDVDLTGDEVTLVSAPMFHIAALGQTFLPTFLKGGKTVMMSSFDVDRAFDLIEKERVTFAFGVPAMFNSLAASPRWATADLSSLRILECGGAPVPESIIRTYQERGLLFLQGYGMTEAAPGALFLGAEHSVRKAGSAGVPAFFTDVKVVDLDGAPNPVGTPGEVIISGPNIMQGYWRRPEDTTKVLTEDGWFHSGDVAVMDGEGYFRIVDRIKDMIISGGENIYPTEIENVLYQHPAIAECAVIGVPDDRWGEVGKAFIVLRPGTTAGADELAEFLRTHLAKYKIPKYFQVLDSLPRNAAGKILKQHLRREDAKD